MATGAESTAVDPALLEGDLDLVGRIAGSSNHSLLATVAAGAAPVHVIYKPIRGERPLWDFPEGTLAGREVAAYLVSELGGWHVVPPTVLRDGPFGTGAVQRWIGDPFAPAADDSVVDLVPAGEVPDGWREVVEGETPDGKPVSVVHSTEDDVRALAVFDAVVNNADRKGSHCLRDEDGRLWAIDHGVTFHPQPKLRTVLWGWAGEPLHAADVRRLEALADALVIPHVREGLLGLLPAGDVEALARRVEDLLRQGRHPAPQPGWPAIPWPAL